MAIDWNVSRRGFIGSAGLTGAGLAGASMAWMQDAAAQTTSGDIPRRPLGKTGLNVSAIGIGGYHLGSAESEQESTRIVHEAIDAGINFFDCAWDYHEGMSEERLG